MPLSILTSFIFGSSLPGQIVQYLSKQTLYSLIVFTLLLPLFFLLKKRSPRWHYCLWILILLRLIIPPGTSQPYSLRNLIIPPATENIPQSNITSPLSLFDSGILADSEGRITPNKRKTIPLPTVFFIFWVGGSLYFFWRYITFLF